MGIRHECVVVLQFQGLFVFPHIRHRTNLFDRPEESRALESFAVTLIAWRVFLISPKEEIARTGFWSLLGVLL